MDRKVKNTIMLIVILLIIVIAGSLFTFWYQSGKIDDREREKKDLELNQFDTDALLAQLKSLKERAVILDSILAMRKYNIPVDILETRFYDFITKVSFNFSPLSYVDIRYNNTRQQDEFLYHLYSLEGIATFNDLYKLVYSIEQSKELKKVFDVHLSNLVKTDEEGKPKYLVSFQMQVQVFYALNDQYSSSNMKENNLLTNPIYDIFYPLIRNEIPPNTEGYLDVQTASLLALIPDGAFLSDASGNTFLLWEGDKVYLGYLTKIDYSNNEVQFILNKGGLIEKVVLKLAEKIQTPSK